MVSFDHTQFLYAMNICWITPWDLRLLFDLQFWNHLVFFMLDLGIEGISNFGFWELFIYTQLSVELQPANLVKDWRSCVFVLSLYYVLYVPPLYYLYLSFNLNSGMDNFVQDPAPSSYLYGSKYVVVLLSNHFAILKLLILYILRDYSLHMFERLSLIVVTGVWWSICD